MSKVITVAPREVLLTRDYIDDLAVSVSRVALSRRMFVEEATQALYDCYENGWRIVTSEGDEIEIYPGVFDDVHADSSDGEWISDLRRRGQNGSQRGPRKKLLGRLQLYDGILRICGRPVGNAARRAEAAEMHELLRGFTSVSRARYVHEVRKLCKTHRDNASLHYGAAVKRLRIRFAQEREAWASQA